ncbi:molybdopterin dinucleotide binding domain-containing protein [Hydrogenobaculum acidophilum]
MLGSLSSKNFDKELIGHCIGCNCGCKFIAYIKDNKIVDVTGHPSDRLGMGSFCTKGIALVQELPFSEFRLKESSKSNIDLDKDIGIFVDRFCTEEELQRAFSFTENIYSNMLYVEKPKTIDVENIPDKKVILNISEPSYSDVMLSRWIIDAKQKGAKVFCTGAIFTNIMFKANYKKLIEPKYFLSFLEDIQNAFLKGYHEDEFINKFTTFSTKLGNALIIIEDSYIRIDRDFVLGFLTHMKEAYGIDYIITGNITHWPVKSIKEHLKDIENHNFIVNVGDMFRYIPDNKLESFSKKDILTISHMTNMSVNLSKYYLPRKFFIEMDFTKKTAFLDISAKKLFEDENSYTLRDILPDVAKNISNIKSSKYEPINLDDYTLFVGNSTVDDMGHYSRWLHEIEPHQYIYINKSLAESINTTDGELLEITTEYGKAIFKVKISANIPNNTFFISNGFDEYQPFYEGVRQGVLAIDKSFVPVVRYRKV